MFLLQFRIIYVVAHNCLYKIGARFQNFMSEANQYNLGDVWMDRINRQFITYPKCKDTLFIRLEIFELSQWNNHDSQVSLIGLAHASMKAVPLNSELVKWSNKKILTRWNVERPRRDWETANFWTTMWERLLSPWAQKKDTEWKVRQRGKVQFWFSVRGIPTKSLNTAPKGSDRKRKKEHQFVKRWRQSFNDFNSNLSDS